MKMSFRWYGDDDPVTLPYIRQIPGMRSIVSAVYDVKPGGVWSEESIAHIAKECEENGLIFDVVESIPVPEDIKLGRGKCEEYIEAYKENIRRVAKYGVKCVGGATIESFTGHGVKTSAGEFEADTCVLALGVKPDRALADELLARYPENVFVVGDCVSSARLLADANQDAFHAAIRIR